MTKYESQANGKNERVLACAPQFYNAKIDGGAK